MEWCPWWNCWHHVTLTPALFALHAKKLILYIFFQSSWPNKCNGAIDSGTGIIWCCANVNSVKCLKSHVTSPLNHLELTKQYYFWWCHQCHVMPTLASHDQECHISPCFNHFDLTNKMVPVTVPSVSFDVSTDADSIIWPREASRLVSIFFIQ